MYNKDFFFNIINIILLALAQVFIFNHINFLGSYQPYIYIVFVLFYPPYANRYLFIFLAFLLSRGYQFSGFSPKTLIIGVGSGLCFAITSILVREASLELSMLPTIHRASWVLLSVISVQCLFMMFYLGLFSRQTLVALWNRLGLTFKVSLCSFMASLGWFTAMSMISVPIVKTLGQIEIIFSLLISAYFFKEKLVKSEYWGLGLVVLAAILVIWA